MKQSLQTESETIELINNQSEEKKLNEKSDEELDEKLNKELCKESDEESNKKSAEYVWLKKLGFISQLRKKGIYFNSYEHSDILEYRSVFFKKMEEFEKLMLIFEGDNMEQKDLILSNKEKLHIFVIYDECLFYTNDDHPIIWASLGKPPLRKKRQEKLIMISDFFLETIGYLKLTDKQAKKYPEIS
ncbi:hypothetical protein RclHR1_10330006 [Rhizophagus clarus]|uniref:Uncharacterized protein n=1 Tax=Rhizophagus clarus TaxID=94130 RepID=A0A2Z6QTJ0_9GLOM|nr:hypothetical protein RclHR1_10330006 [Rhizophagus clarus]